MIKEVEINGIILSSGYSSRMGVFKPLLKHNGVSFCAEIIRKLKLICGKVVVVTGHNSPALLKHLEEKNMLSDGTVFSTYNSDFPLGMFTSMQAGIKTLTGNCWALMHMVDQPNIPDQFYTEIPAHLDASFDWIQPLYDSRKGHPLIINSNLFSKIINAPQNSTLRTLFTDKEIKRKIFDCNYPQILTDIDTPEDYNKLLKNPETI